MKLNCIGCEFENMCRNYCISLNWNFETYREKHPDGCHIIAENKIKRKKALENSRKGLYRFL